MYICIYMRMNGEEDGPLPRLWLDALYCSQTAGSDPSPLVKKRG
jgi:hypothetical protein